MKRKKPIFISLTLTLLTSVFAFNILSNKAILKVKADPASGASFYATNEDNKYYQGIDEGLMGEDLIVALSTLTSTGFVSKSYSSLPSIYQYSDRSLNDPSLMQMVYTGTLKSFSPGGIPGSANKEHVWPASWYGSNKREEGGGTPGADAHNILPSATDLNSKRGTSAFDELPFATSFKALEFGTTNYGTVGNNDSYVWSTAFDRSNGQNDDILYPAIGYRGTIARILMYVATRYRNDSRFPVMLHDQSTTLKIGRIGKLSTLLKWHFIEPPSAFEIKRNNEVATRWHHNRNPFVDNPDYARRIFYHLPEPDQTSVSPLVKNVIETYAGAPSEGIRLSHTNVSLTVGQTKSVSVTDNPRNEVITWTSTNNSVATVSNGLITAQNVGNTIIKATGQTSSASVSVTVSEENSEVLVTSLSVSLSSLTLNVGQNASLTTTISPSNATNKEVVWSSSNSTIVSVNNGNISALKAGSATISVKTTDGSNLSAQTSVTVKEVSTEAGYHLVTNISELNTGDKVLIASRDKNVVAGDLSNAIYTTVPATFNAAKDVITSADSSAALLTLGKNGTYFTFTNNSGALLGATTVKKIAYNGGVTDWDLSFYEDNVIIQNKTSTNGRFLYNVNFPRFTTYTSATNNLMLLPQLYKLVEPVETTSDKAHNYATLFLDGTANECASGNVTLTTWNHLKSEYLSLEDSVKDYLYDYSEIDPLIIDLLARYSVIINKYHYDNFMVNSEDIPLYEVNTQAIRTKVDQASSISIYFILFVVGPSVLLYIGRKCRTKFDT